MLLRHSAQLHDPSPHVAVDATYYERSPASKRYYERTNCRVQTVEATELVDTETQAILHVHCTTTRGGSDADVCAQLARVPAGELQTLAADEGYDSQQERNQLEKFASIVSHDLRSPLNVAEGRLELAKKECDSEHLDDVSRAHGRMRALIDDLLTLAREGDEVGEFESVDLSDLTQSCWQTVGTGYSTSEEGTGFGLAIVKQIADAHGWEIRVTDGSDCGARFEIIGVEFAE